MSHSCGSTRPCAELDGPWKRDCNELGAKGPDFHAEDRLFTCPGFEHTINSRFEATAACLWLVVSMQEIALMSRTASDRDRLSRPPGACLGPPSAFSTRRRQHTGLGRAILAAAERWGSDDCESFEHGATCATQDSASGRASGSRG